MTSNSGGGGGAGCDGCVLKCYHFRIIWYWRIHEHNTYLCVQSMEGSRDRPPETVTEHEISVTKTPFCEPVQPVFHWSGEPSGAGT